MIGYHELAKICPEKAREIVRKVLERNNGNVSATARVLGISRNTVRRARDGPLENLSRRPHSSPSKTSSSLEGVIVEEAKRTGFRYRRLSAYLLRKYGLSISENTVKAILRRNGMVKEKRRKKGNYRHLYDYTALMPFTESQLDTKHLLDRKSLPKEVYQHMIQWNLPKYEWNMIDICTRARFTAYSYELSLVYGFLFIVIVVLWLRAHGVRGEIRIRLDNGSEFCGGSERKLREWNEELKVLGVVLEPIPAGQKRLLSVIENSHRADDEYFLMIHGERCKSRGEFILKAQGWQDTWNFFRANYGIGMEGKTPCEKLMRKDLLISTHVLLFPVMMMEDLIKFKDKIQEVFKGGDMCLEEQRGGKYVPTKCQRV